jgi:hypothetical protein
LSESGTEVFQFCGFKVTSLILCGIIGGCAVISFLVFCASWLDVEVGQALQIFGGLSSGSVHGFGFSSGQGGVSGFLFVLAMCAFFPLVVGAVLAFRRQKSIIPAIGVLTSGIMHLLCAVVFIMVARVANGEFTDEKFGRLGNVTPAGGWYMGVLLGFFLIVAGGFYFVTMRRKQPWGS